MEIFDGRVEVTNPGLPIIPTLRFIGESPRSRNEALARVMRRMRICEERGSGMIKIVSSVETFQLPAPAFTTSETHTKATLFAPRPLAKMDRDDRVRACYQHACLRYLSGDEMTNTTLRERFGIEQKNYSTASRIIRETIDAKLVFPVDPESGNKHMRYVPFWAAPDTEGPHPGTGRGYVMVM